jgi:hypothetical protein
MHRYHSFTSNKNSSGVIPFRVAVLLLVVFIAIALTGSFLLALGTSTNSALAQGQDVPNPTPIPDPENDTFLQSVQESYTSPGIEVDDHVITVTMVASVTAGDDDAGMLPNCNNSLTANEIYFGNCAPNTPIISGFRFAQVDIPDNANLVSAYVQFTVDGEYTNAFDVVVYGEYAANSLDFNAGVYPSDRLTQATNNFVTWTITETWNSWDIKNTPSLLEIVQEITGHPNWVSENPITLLFTAEEINTGIGTPSPHRRVFAFERLNSASNTAKLVLVYTKTRSVDPILSTLVATPEVAVADGIDRITATVTLSDTYGPLSNQEVNLLANEPISITWPDGNHTNDNGQVIAYSIYGFIR